MFDFSIVTNWIHELLLSIMPEGLAIFIECVAVGDAAPHTPFDAVVERLREAFRPDGAISTHNSGTLLVFTFGKQCIG